jgi:tetratricopeptide (TPR) repeat protein
MRKVFLLLMLATLASAQPPPRAMSPLDMMQPWLKGDFAKSRQYYIDGDDQFTHRYRVDMELELAHYRICSQILKEDNDKSYSGFVARRARLIYQTGDLANAEKVALRAGLKNGNRYDLHLSNTLGLIQLARGHNSEAADLFKARLKLPHKPNAKIDDPEIVLALIGLARAYVALGNLNTADEFAGKALALSTNSWGPHSIPALDAMQALAESRILQRDFKQARELLDVCIRERSRLYTEPNPKVADTLEAEARYNLAIGDGQNALKLAGHAMEIRQQIFGGPSLWSAQALMTKGDIYAAVGAFDQAARCFDNAVPVLEASLGADAPAAIKARAQRDSLHNRLHTTRTTFPASCPLPSSMSKAA